MVELYVAECGLSWGMFPVYLKKKSAFCCWGQCFTNVSYVRLVECVKSSRSLHIFSTCPIQRHREECFSLYLYLCISLFFLLVLSIFPSYILKLFCYVYTHLGLLYLIGKWIPSFLFTLSCRSPRIFFFCSFSCCSGFPLCPGLAAPLLSF